MASSNRASAQMYRGTSLMRNSTPLGPYLAHKKKPLLGPFESGILLNVQGCLAHKKQPPPRRLESYGGPREVDVPYERGTPVFHTPTSRTRST